MIANRATVGGNMASKAKATKKTPRKLSDLRPPKALPEKAPEATVRIVGTSLPMGEQYQLHPGNGLTPERLMSSFVCAEGGDPSMQCDIFDDILERDAHLRSLYDGRIEAVAGKSWMLAAGGDEDADGFAARSLETALRRVPRLVEMFEHLLTANFYGYAAVEIVWDKVDGVIAPVWFVPVPHRRILFDTKTDEPLVRTIENPRGEPMSPGRWIFAGKLHRSTVRAGLMRAASRLALLKALALRDWSIYSARFGMPYVVGKHDPNADEETISTLTQAVLKFGRNGGAVFSNNAELEVVESKSQGNTSSVHPAFVDVCNREMSKLILGATLTSGEGSSTGSYALGQVHADTKFDRIAADAEDLGHWIATGIGEPFTRWNGLAARPPRLRARVVREVDPVSRMKIASTFANELGGALDEDQIREEFDLRRPTGDALTGSKTSAGNTAEAPPQ